MSDWVSAVEWSELRGEACGKNGVQNALLHDARDLGLYTHNTRHYISKRDRSGVRTHALTDRGLNAAP